MSDKRNPDYTILLKKPGKTSKVELFRSEQFGVRFRNTIKYRLRVSGKWYGGREKVFFTRWEFRDIFFRSIPI